MRNAVLIHQEGAVRILTNNNPTARNAILPTLYAELSAALADAAADPAVGAVVFTGAGNFFCSGGDLNLLVKRRDLPVAERREKLEGLHDLIRAIRDFGKPVIAAVEGGAAGAGVSMALACDMLVVARDAFFSVAYVKVGLTPDGGATAFLSEFVSRQVLTEMCLTGESVPAERLHALGAVNRLTKRGAALAEAIALAERVATGPLNASARIKSLCRQAHRATLEEQLELEATYMVQAQADAEAAEGIGAFLAKRPTDFLALRRRKPDAS